jgi:carboxyl-terminal processing protease
LTRKQTGIKNTLAVAKKEKSTVPLLRNTNNFLQHFKKRRNTVRQNQEEIKGLIIDEIIKRYQYQEGLSIFIKLIQK